MSTVTLNADERETVIDALVNEDGCCFNEDERGVLHSLSDKTLARLTVNAGVSFAEAGQAVRQRQGKQQQGLRFTDEEPLPLQVLNFDVPAFDRPGVTGGAVPDPQYGTWSRDHIDIPGFTVHRLAQGKRKVCGDAAGEKRLGGRRTEVPHRGR